MQIDPFFQVPMHTHTTSAGEVELPLLIKEADCTIALFLCSRDRVWQQLEGSGMQPALEFGRHALVGMSLYNVEQSNFGPHRCMVLSIPVVRQRGFRPVSPWRELFARADKRHMGFYPLSIMTNSALKTTVGRELWGFPNYLSQVDFELRESRIACRVSNGPQTLMELTGNGFRICRAKRLDYNMFSRLNNQLLRALLVTRGQFHAQFPLGYRLRLGAASHPLTDQLRALELDGKRPLALVSSSNYQARMQEGVVVEQLPDQALLPQPKSAHLVV